MSPRKQRRLASAAAFLATAAVAGSASILGAMFGGCSSGGSDTPPPVLDASSADATDAQDAQDARSPEAAKGCDAGGQMCNGVCVDLASDNAHCGACSVACTAAQFCFAGACSTCSDIGKVACGGACTDVLSDPANCGLCGHACGAGQQCQDGNCVTPCGDGGVLCGNECLDTSNDPNNCGACGHACGAGQTCGGRACLCGDAAMVACGPTCTDPTTDKQHCGATAGCGINAGWAGLACTGYCSAGGCNLCQSWAQGWSTAVTGSDSGQIYSVPTFAVADFNQDTHPDLALLQPETGTVTIYSGLANATFNAGASYTVGSSPVAITSGDFNGDGHPDFAVANLQAPNYVGVWLGDGQGGFAPGASVAIQNPAGGIVAGDLNGDHRDDLVVEMPPATEFNNQGNQVTVYDVQAVLSQPDNTFSVGPDFSPMIVSLADVAFGALALSDLDGDGHLDLILSNEGGGAGLGLPVALFGNGDGTFGASEGAPSSWVAPPGFYGGNIAQYTALLVGDVNGDHQPDLLFESGVTSSVLSWAVALNQGARSFAYPQRLQGPNGGEGSLLADVTGDGVLDFVGNDPNGAFSASLLSVRAGVGDGTFLPSVTFPYAADWWALLANDNNSLYAHDLNGDGYVDVVGTTDEGIVVLDGSKSTAAECP